MVLQHAFNGCLRAMAVFCLISAFSVCAGFSGKVWALVGGESEADLVAVHPADDAVAPSERVSGSGEKQNIGGPFMLEGPDGKEIKNTDFLGKWLIIYFGYTYCPDLCPTGLQTIARVLDKLKDKEVQNVQPLFITIDPARDTAEKMKEYAASFNPAILGLTGTAEQISKVAKAYGVYYKKAEEVEEGQYLMDHSTGIYLMGPDGAFIAKFTENEKPNNMVAALRKSMNKK